MELRGAGTFTTESEYPILTAFCSNLIRSFYSLITLRFVPKWSIMQEESIHTNPIYLVLMPGIAMQRDDNIERAPWDFFDKITTIIYQFCIVSGAILVLLVILGGVCCVIERRKMLEQSSKRK